jgi:predicted metal-dependent hydrolase
MSITILNIPSLGSVVFAQSKRAKKMSISIRPFKPVRVAFPQRIPLKKAKRYLFNNLTWAKKNLDYIRKIEKEHQTTVNDKPKLPKTKAKIILRNRLNQLANIHGFKYNKVSIRNQKTRWGSCSNRNNISLNINLVSLTQELMDYVILHELLHTKINNHSKKFWAQLDKYVGGRAKDIDKRLKKHTLGL